MTITCADGACDEATLRVEVGGGTLFSQSRGPLSAGESFTETVATSIDTTGSVEIFAVWGQTTTSASVFVEDEEPVFDPDRVFVPSGECTVEPQRIDPPEDVQLSAVVENQNEESANATVEWTWQGDVLDRTLVNVFARSTQEAFGSAMIDRDGRDQVRAEVVRVDAGTVDLEHSSGTNPISAGNG